MRVQLAWTMVTELLVTISGILILKLAATFLGPAGFGEYTITRRAIGLLYLPLVLGFGVAAPRYIAIARAKAIEGYTESAFATATLTAGLLPPIVAALILNLAPHEAAAVLLGSASLAHIVPAATIALFGISLHSMVYAVYRGRSEMKFANVLQIVDLAIAPPLAFALASKNAADVLELTGVLWIVFAGIALIHVLIRERSEWRGFAPVNEHIKVLLRFGLPRVPGEFALVGLFAIPSLLAVKEHGIIAAGQFSAALSVLTMASSGFAPVGLVVLPRASAQVATGDLAGLRKLVQRILIGGILLVTLGVVIGELLIPFFVRWYFGQAFVPAIPYFRAVLLGAIPYAVYILMRSILDAVDVRALNSINLIITVSIVTMVCAFTSSILWTSFGIVAALAVLAVLTLRDVFARVGRKPAGPRRYTAGRSSVA